MRQDIAKHYNSLLHNNEASVAAYMQLDEEMARGSRKKKNRRRKKRSISYNVNKYSTLEE